MLAGWSFSGLSFDIGKPFNVVVQGIRAGTSGPTCRPPSHRSLRPPFGSTPRASPRRCGCSCRGPGDANAFANSQRTGACRRAGGFQEGQIERREPQQHTYTKTSTSKQVQSRAEEQQFSADPSWAGAAEDAVDLRAGLRVDLRPRGHCL